MKGAGWLRGGMVRMGRLPVFAGTRRIEASNIRYVPLGFLLLILLGAVFLGLPFSAAGPGRIPWLDALFLSTSAVCVTGLSTVDVAGTLSPMGQAGLLGLIQLGGLGILTAGMLLVLVRGDRLTLAHERSIHATVGRLRRARPLDVFLYACFFVFVIELAGMVALYHRLDVADADVSPEAVLWQAAFHSVSAFCNAGLSIWPGGMSRWKARPDILAIVEILVFFGGIGLLSLVNLRYWYPWRRDPTCRGALTLQTKLSVVAALFLIGLGMLASLALEVGHSQEGLSWDERLSWSLFHSVMSRTAGFSVADPATMHPATLLMTMALMFIGGAPGSMAGGIKTVTLVLLLLSARAAVRREEEIRVFRRRIPSGQLGIAVMISLLAFACVMSGMLLLMITEEGHAASQSPHRWLALAFEAVSAFGTTGLSTGITASLTPGGKFVIILLMFAGRVGPLALALHLSRPAGRWHIRHPAEDLSLG